MNTDVLDGLQQAGLLVDIDRAFADLIADFDGRERPEVAIAAALASARCRAGHVYLDLARFAGGSVVAALGAPPADGPRTPSLDDWREALRDSPAVAAPGSAQRRPLVLDERDRLYLARFRSAERRVADRLLALAAPAASDPGRSRALVDALFPADDVERRRAARTMLERRFCVVTGGPGTGKTTLAARLIALLVGVGLARPERVGLAAPTGKAAARIQEAVGRQTSELATHVPALHGYVARASTVHRLLSRARRGPASRRSLPLDLLVLDEASMVDLRLMARLLEALPERVRLVVLGDAKQLASVQPGAVLGDLCDVAAAQDGPLHACVVALTKSYRFAAGGGIGRLAAAIVGGDAGAALAALRDATDPVTELRPAGHAEDFARIAAAYAASSVAPCIRGLRDRGAGAEPFPAARVLCAHRVGPFGAERFNRLVEDRLRSAGLAPHGERFYAGRPVIVTRNDPVTGLSNGDTGVVLHRDGAVRVWFPELGTDAEPFEVAPARLPEHESFFALTVHRSQGSEYDEVAFVPGPADSRVATRELFYTAVTRARRKVTVYGSPASVVAAVERVTERAGGLEFGPGA